VTIAHCHICGNDDLKTVSEFEKLCLVTSDCKLHFGHSQLFVCSQCGIAQKAVHQEWQSAVDKIYRDYTIYHQSGGREQMVFDFGSGQAKFRSDRLIDYIAANVELFEKGNLLDIGCGNGAFLQTFGRQFPRWSLAGIEFSDKYKQKVESIQGVNVLYTCPPFEIPDIFSMITAIHFLEHLCGPVEYLNRLKDKFSSNGYLAIQVPNYRQNPFDLLILDHCTHFTDITLKTTVENALYNPIAVSSDWIKKETIIIAKPGANGDQPAIHKRPQVDNFKNAVKAVKWLQRVKEHALYLSKKGQIGIFGTSISGTWLYSEISRNVEFFVDEDQNRVGRNYMGLPVYHPRDLSPGKMVYIALPYPISKTVKSRLTKSFPSITWINTPDSEK
jgi:2-polyprenyl-3-methyl-5-hydroxy-6-metoxy-1,4-benzoquinol methylase